MGIFRFILLFLILGEFVLYFIKYWKIFPTFRIFEKYLYQSGVPISRGKIVSKFDKDKILELLKEKWKTKKIIENRIYLRRNYFKIFPWITPVPLQTIIYIKDGDNGCILEIYFKTLYFPWIGSLLPIIFCIFDNTLNCTQIIIQSMLLLFFTYVIGYVEKCAIYYKLRRFSELNPKYYFFA